MESSPWIIGWTINAITDVLIGERLRDTPPPRGGEEVPRYCHRGRQRYREDEGPWQPGGSCEKQRAENLPLESRGWAGGSLVDTLILAR